MKITATTILDPKSEYQNVHFERVTFASLQGISFEGCTFKKCDFSNADFSRTDIRNCRLIQCKLVGVKFSKENFAFSANFEGCNLQYTDFIELNLQKIQITDSICKNMRIFHCDLRHGLFKKNDFHHSVIQECKLDNSQFLECNNLLIDPHSNSTKATTISFQNGIDILESMFQFRVDQ